MSTHNTRNNSDGGEVFVISVAAELAGMHAQTLRTYDRMGLVIPQRTRGVAATPAGMLMCCAKSSD